MIPFHASMYPDDILIYRSRPVTDDEGDARRAFPDPPEPRKANVMSKTVDRVTKGGATVSTTVHAISTATDPNVRADDKIVWMGRNLTVEARAIPKGIGNVTWRIQCVESK